MTNISKIKYTLLFLTIASLIYIYYRHIEFQNNDYTVQNEKGEKLNAVVIENGDVIRVIFPEIKDCKFISIVKEIKYIDVNGFLPINLGANTYFFGDKAKKIGYSDGIRYLKINNDTIKFNTFIYYTMDLSVLGEEIVIFKNR
ncbi:MAG TPA: hypothetical protein PKD51_07375 [Saprospiraceae bacterium]|nr:hypothetical protein [Saprospiraceae bacterium]HMU03452.1 hypothetical protein [Saprospiraceae bacterium]